MSDFRTIRQTYPSRDPDGGQTRLEVFSAGGERADRVAVCSPVFSTKGVEVPDVALLICETLQKETWHKAGIFLGPEARLEMARELLKGIPGVTLPGSPWDEAKPTQGPVDHE